MNLEAISLPETKVPKTISLPKIKISKKRHNFTPKKDNYKPYQFANWKWNEVFAELDKLLLSDTKGARGIISKKRKINYNTLKSKYSKWILDGRPTIVDEENRGGHNKVFTEQEERDLYEYILNVYIGCNLLYDDECLRISAIKKFNQLHPNKIDEFTASQGWISDFKRRWKLSSLKASFSRIATTNTDDITKTFLEKCNSTFQTEKASLIFNTDETFWRTFNSSQYVIGVTNSENRKVDINVDPKEGVTAVFTISAAGLFLPPIVIIKGTTERCLTKTKHLNDPNIILDYSQNGWINVYIMITIFCQIFNISKGRPAFLILDCYSVHRVDFIKIQASIFNIQLIYVPQGKTSKHQPLDVKINGPIKTIGKKITKEIYLTDPFSKIDISDSVDSLIESFKLIQKNTIISSFEEALGLSKKIREYPQNIAEMQNN